VGERRLPLREVSAHFTGVALELMPSPRFERKKAEPPLALRQLLGRVRGLPSALLQVLGLALVLEIFALVSPLFVQTVLDQVVAGGDRNLLTLLGLGFALLTVLQVGVSALRTWVVMWLGTSLNLAWAGNVFGHLLKLPEEYFAKRHLGDISSRFQATSVIQNTLTTRAVETVLDGVMTVLTLGMMLLYSRVLAALTLLAFALYAGLRALSYRVFREANLGPSSPRPSSNRCSLNRCAARRPSACITALRITPGATSTPPPTPPIAISKCSAMACCSAASTICCSGSSASAWCGSAPAPSSMDNSAPAC